MKTMAIDMITHLDNRLVSVILPTFNREHLLERAITSVLSQSYHEWELIVWDDGSRDNTRDVVMGFSDQRIRYFFAENRGVAVARNQAISDAKGEYLAFLDSDDEWMSEKLSVQMAALQAHPEIDLVFSDFENVNLVLNKRGTNFVDYGKAFQLMTTTDLGSDFFEIRDGFLESLTQGNYIATDTVVVKKSVIDMYGGFNESLRNSEDFELWWRLGVNNVRIVFHKQVLMTRYKPQDSLTSLSAKSASSALRALDLCAKEAISVNRVDLVDYLKGSYRIAWHNMITACAMENDKNGMMNAFRQSLKYGFRPGSLRLLVEGLLRFGGNR